MRQSANVLMLVQPWLRCWLLATLCLALVACGGTSLRDDLELDPASYAPAPATSGVLHDIAADLASRNPETHSGFHLLEMGKWLLVL